MKTAPKSNEQSALQIESQNIDKCKFLLPGWEIGLREGHQSYAPEA